MKKGIFITFEGIEGTGKSTQIAFLRSFLKNSGLDVVTTREPGGTEPGEDIRSLIFKYTGRQLDKKAELFLFLASRAQLLKEIILPALNEGKTVICDRYADATAAYQGYGRSLPLELIYEANRLATDNLQPDLTFLLDADPEISLQRLHKRVNKNHFDNETVEFHNKIRQGYLSILKDNGNRIKLVNANLNLEEVRHQIKNIASSFINNQDWR